MNFFPTNDFSLLKSCQLYIIAKYKASSWCDVEAVIQRCSVKSAFLKILQNFLWILWIFKNTFFIEHLRLMPQVKLEPSVWNQQNFSSSCFWLHLISRAPSTLWQNNCKEQYSQINICRGVVHSYCNSNFQTFKLTKNSFQ